MSNRRRGFLLGLALAALALPAWAMAPDEAAGILWGTLPGAVKLAMKDRPGVVLQEEAPDHLTFTGGELAGKAVKSRRFDFTDGRMSRLKVNFVCPPGTDARGLLADHLRDDLLGLLSKKYGPIKEQPATDTSRWWQWTWPHPVVQNYLRQIQFTQNSRDGSLTLVYLDNQPAPTPTPAPATPPPAATPKLLNDL